MGTIIKGMKWTSKEDEFLTKAVKQHGTTKGFEVTSNRLKHRTKNTCAYRYYNVISPPEQRNKDYKLTPRETSHRPWSDADKRILISTLGKNNTPKSLIQISNLLNRSIASCKSTYNRHVESTNKDKPALVSKPKNTNRRSKTVKPSSSRLNTINIHDGGSNHKADIILNRDNLVVAKYGDLVITFEK